MKSGSLKGEEHGMRVTLSISISLEQALKLKELAKKRKLSVQDVIRSYIDQETS